MKAIVLNMSHPLSDEAMAQLAAEIGKFEVVNVPVQIDFDQPIKQQLDALAGQAPALFHYWIPPALSYAAAYIGAKFAAAQSDAYAPTPKPMIVLKRDGMPPRFVLSEIVG